jgi:hypothetical protein
MALIDDVTKICRRLARMGWNELLAMHGLNLNAKDIESELARELTGIDRTAAGFEDFCLDGNRAIEPGIPARSLLYHAMASPLVHPAMSSGSNPDPTPYPTLEEIDTVENYIYSLTRCKLADFPGAVVVVFSYQYRTAPRTAHGLFADLVFSRTGVSRVGTAPQNYDRIRRSFWVAPPDGTGGICAMPARFAAFLAMAAPPHASGVVLDKLPDDKGRKFLFPVQKLFAGNECLGGESSTLDIRFHQYHRNEKLSRIHSHGKIPAFPGFDINASPYVRDTENSKDLLSLQTVGSSALVVPNNQEFLVRTATQTNSVSGKNELVRFTVPPERGRDDRFSTSLQIEFKEKEGRQAPEYVNIRHQVTTSAGGKQSITDLNALSDAKFTKLLRIGGYEAAHFVDDTCDGYVAATVTGLSKKLPDKPAYSLVTAPDFFPLADQIEITHWAKQSLVRLQDHFNQGSPEPLSSGRLAANPHLQRLEIDSPAFDRDDTTMTAMVCCLQVGSKVVQEPKAAAFRDPATTFLPDGASDVFEPGWDVSAAGDSKGQFYAAFGLGSPFPEDAKLCAALNSFWPAAAPDAARTFGRVTAPTAIPMLDIELGFHPDHPSVKNGAQKTRTGWDGEFGPFFETVQGALCVNYASLDRSDYVSNALAGKITVSGLMEVSADELIDRMEALEACIRQLPVTPHVVSATKLFLVAVEKVSEWENRPDKGDTRIAGPGFLYIFALPQNESERVTSDIRRKRVNVKETFTCQVSIARGKAVSLCFRKNDDVSRFISEP